MSLPRVIRRAAIVAGLAALAVGGTAGPANAAPLVFPSCPGFDVGLTPLTNHGNPIQAGPRAVQVAGNGTSVLDNETTGATLTFVGSGAFNAQENSDGSHTFTATGRSIVFLFPTDPGGPATTIYTGGLVSMLSADGTFRVISHTGGVIDVCALLGS
ncbi:MAG TPA: hypothetical protein VFH38_07705 [Jatrophihabitans sp.]|nr:hypothetical protein [Jatrophihabitans sp.]